MYMGEGNDLGGKVSKAKEVCVATAVWGSTCLSLYNIIYFHKIKFLIFKKNSVILSIYVEGVGMTLAADKITKVSNTEFLKSQLLLEVQA